MDNVIYIFGLIMLCIAALFTVGLVLILIIASWSVLLSNIHHAVSQTKGFILYLRVVRHYRKKLARIENGRHQ